MSVNHSTGSASASASTAAAAANGTNTPLPPIPDDIALHTSEFIDDRLYFIPNRARKPKADAAHFFSIDNRLRHEPFFGDFGPLSLGNLYRFCQMLRIKLKSAKHAGKRIFFYCGTSTHAIANAAVLMGGYAVIYLRKTPEEAYDLLRRFEPYASFRDAALGVCTFNLTVAHCLSALAKAHKYQFFDFEKFKVEEYEYFECVENGDLNILLPGKFMAFAGPYASSVGADGYPTLTPADYLPIFKRYNVKTVIRLNKECYDRRKFVDAGLAHHDMYFIDGTTPTDAIISRFLRICEEAKFGELVAVHCKAGLGRTGTLIGCYLMKHYRMTAAEVIAWMRIARPGSVIGPQQHFLQMKEKPMWKMGRASRKTRREQALASEEKAST